jgi:fluoroacetyl-CoA thioesterase
MSLQPGMRSSVTIVVTEADTAIAVGSGDVPVLATPRVLALAEAAAVQAIAGALPDGQTSVGTAAELEHRLASATGTEIVVEAELTGIAGRRLTFRFMAVHGRPGDPEDRVVVSEGTIQRVIVNRDSFITLAAGG